MTKDTTGEKKQLYGFMHLTVNVKIFSRKKSNSSNFITKSQEEKVTNEMTGFSTIV
jgi:hypothetical protein